MMRYPNQRGFTLIETMVAITLLAIALIGPFVAVQNAVQSSYIARDQLIASQLAQEGIEYVRFIRDNNYMNGRSWIDGFSDASRNGCFGNSPTGYCTIDATKGDFHTTAAGMLEYTSTSTTPFLKLSSANLYNHDATGGSDTRFKRIARIYTLNANEIQIVVQVLWTSGPRSYSITVVDNLFDWI